MDHIIWYPIIVGFGQWEALTGDGRTRGNINQYIYSSYSLPAFHGSNNNPFITIASVWWSLILVILAPGWVLITSCNYLHESSKQHILKFSFKYTTLWILKKKNAKKRQFSIFRKSVWQYSMHEAVLGAIHPLQFLKVFFGTVNVDQCSCRRDQGTNIAMTYVWCKNIDESSTGRIPNFYALERSSQLTPTQLEPEKAMAPHSSTLA